MYPLCLPNLSCLDHQGEAAVQGMPQTYHQRQTDMNLRDNFVRLQSGKKHIANVQWMVVQPPQGFEKKNQPNTRTRLCLTQVNKKQSFIDEHLFTIIAYHDLGENMQLKQQ